MEEQEVTGVASGPDCSPSGAQPPAASSSQQSIPNASEWPEIEYEGCYPFDESFSDFEYLPPDFRKAARWLYEELPRAAENMLCFCEVTNGRDCVGAPVKLLSFSTGGWSGAESIIGLIERRFDLKHHMLTWKRGGHFVFEIPCAYLVRQGIEAPAAGESAENLT